VNIKNKIKEQEEEKHSNYKTRKQRAENRKKGKSKRE